MVSSHLDNLVGSTGQIQQYVIIDWYPVYYRETLMPAKHFSGRGCHDRGQARHGLPRACFRRHSATWQRRPTYSTMASRGPVSDISLVAGGAFTRPSPNAKHHSWPVPSTTTPVTTSNGAGHAECQGMRDESESQTARQPASPETEHGDEA